MYKTQQTKILNSWRLCKPKLISIPNRITLASNIPYPKKNGKLRTKHIPTTATTFKCTKYKITNVTVLIKNATNINIIPNHKTLYLIHLSHIRNQE